MEPDISFGNRTLTAQEVKAKIDSLTKIYLQQIILIADECEEPIALQVIPIRTSTLFINIDNNTFEIKVINEDYKKQKSLLHPIKLPFGRETK